jgi:hypothetical protein
MTQMQQIEVYKPKNHVRIVTAWARRSYQHNAQDFAIDRCRSDSLRTQ